MKLAGMYAKQKHKFNMATDSDHNLLISDIISRSLFIKV